MIVAAHDTALAERVAIVTGGAGGIGSATGAALAKHGAAVVLVDRDERRVGDAVSALGAEPGRALGVVGDVCSEADMSHVTAAVVEKFGRIDILVAAAGILRGRHGAPRPFPQLTVDEWDDVVGVNLRGTFLSNRAVLQTMVRQRAGQIVNVSSTSGRRGRAFDGIYCASKFGVVGLSEATAEEVRHLGIRVHVVLPDAVRTALWDQNGPVKCPPNALDPARVGEFIVSLLMLPPDMQLLAPVIVPFRRTR
jgi:NAD(P)-dependent dehydrogenase (short-subunit alcohol dehydrogenase family)